jgi:hypothetical protein
MRSRCRAGRGLPFANGEDDHMSEQAAEKPEDRDSNG